MTGYESKRAAAQSKLVVTDIDGHVVRDARKPKKAQPAQEPVSWAVVGDGKFGKYELGQVFVDYEATHIYWKNRGYELVPVYTTPPQEFGLTRERFNALEAEITTLQSDWLFAVKEVVRLKAAQREQERNFCPRCGKRTSNLETIHTCTPPQI